MTTVRDVCEFLDEFAPPSLAEEWDNVGLLVGDGDSPVGMLMTCLTVTPQSAAEAIQSGAKLIVAHHPLPFRPLKRLTRETVPGRLLLDLIHAGVAVYSPHTAFDSAAGGINQRLAEGVGLHDIAPLVAVDDASPNVGGGRYGTLPSETPLADVAEQLKAFLGIDGLHIVGDSSQAIRKIAVACGSAGEFLASARRAGCDLLITGETSFHTCLEAEAHGIALLLPGHFASERFAVECLADVLNERFDGVSVWSSRQEHDPLRWI